MNLLKWIWLLGCVAFGQDSGLEVIYLGNEGFYVKSESVAVAVDGLHQKRIPPYLVVPVETRRQMLMGQTPFERLDALLVTHEHSDHFSADLALQLLGARSNVHVLAPAQAADRLAGEHERLVEIRPTSQPWSLGGLKVTVLDLHHGKGRPIDHNAYLVEMDGFRWVHFGDTEIQPAELAPYRSQLEEPLDVAFLPFWLLFEEAWRAELTRVLPTKAVVIMHIPAVGEDAFVRSKGGISGMIKDFQAVHPAILAFRQVGDRLVFDR